jgi:hypothetical protein
MLFPESSVFEEIGLVGTRLPPNTLSSLSNALCSDVVAHRHAALARFAEQWGRQLADAKTGLPEHFDVLARCTIRFLTAHDAIWALYGIRLAGSLEVFTDAYLASRDHNVVAREKLLRLFGVRSDLVNESRAFGKQLSGGLDLNAKVLGGVSATQIFDWDHRQPILQRWGAVGMKWP